MSYLAMVQNRKPLTPQQQAQLDAHREMQAKGAVELLNRTGARIIVFAAGDEAIGIWSDLDSRAIRDAIRSIGLHDLPVVYLDSPKCPSHYKVRRVPGEPVALSVLRMMEAAEERGEPGWTARDAPSPKKDRAETAQVASKAPSTGFTHAGDAASAL